VTDCDAAQGYDLDKAMRPASEKGMSDDRGGFINDSGSK
jgi:hypothetical protein